MRYEKTVTDKCRIKFMTDGILLRELSADLLLSQYSVIVLDEAHERGLNTDILLGILSRVVTLRAAPPAAADDDARRSHPGPLKLIVMSATLQVESLRDNSRLWKTPPPVINVDARQHPVTCHFSRVTADDHMMAAFKKVRIHSKLPPGGILVFLTGQREIEEMCAELRKKFGRRRRRAPAAEEEEEATPAAEDDDDEEEKGRSGLLLGEEEEEEEGAAAAAFAGFGDSDDDDDDDYDEEEEERRRGGRGRRRGRRRGGGEAAAAAAGGGGKGGGGGGPVLVLLYSMLRASEQRRVFAAVPEGTRLIVVATNVAETSLTIPNIRYVVDSGKHKQRDYGAAGGADSAAVRYSLEWVSQASANQRAGRAGRVGPGHCYRLYSSSVFENIFPQFSAPEMERVPIEGVVLQMKNLGIRNVRAFPFPSPPPPDALAAAEASLAYLGAIEHDVPPPPPTPLRSAEGAAAAAAAAAMAAPAAASRAPGDGAPITALGRLLARLPVSARLGKLLLGGRQAGVLEYALPLVAMLLNPT